MACHTNFTFSERRSSQFYNRASAKAATKLSIIILTIWAFFDF
jgi:hypothetical protein